jgi:prepilin-type N-terminal cleavage/methylation domain-containing protein
LPTSPWKPGNSGFTLVEMLLVVTLIGVMAAIAVPRYSRSFEHLKVRSAAYDVAAALEYAQAVSVLQDRRLRVTFGANGDECDVVADEFSSDESPIGDSYRRLPEGVKVDMLDFLDPFLSGRRYVGFRPSGECDRCVISVKGRSGDVYRVIVGNRIGTVRVQRGLEET